MAPARALIAAFVLTFSVNALGAVVDIPARQGTVRVLYESPVAPTAVLAVIAGNDGTFGIRDDGSMPTRTAECSPFARNRADFIARGYAVLLVDRASDGVIYDPHDIAAAIAYARRQANVPVWITGGSNSTQVTWDMAVGLPPIDPVGMVFFSPQAVDTHDATAYGRPTLVVTHRDDLSADARPLLLRIGDSPDVQGVTLAGGSAGGCRYHLFQGLDAQFIGAVTEFTSRYTSTLAARHAASTAEAVEYYHAGLDHYFITHLSAEMAALDAGDTIKGWMRTGQSFRVAAMASATTSPVCRFYIPPQLGNSHFYGRGVEECGETASKNPAFVQEDGQFFHLWLPAAGECPLGTVPVYRVFSNRADANHRYATRLETRDAMVAAGWVAEGDGPDRVVMCASW